MNHKKEIVLKVERFHDEEDIEFRIPSKREMLSILQRVAEQGTRVALYYDEHDNFILTTLLGINENGIWLDIGPFPPENENLLLSKKITFVSVHQNVKVQFVAHHVENALFENANAFYLELPDYLLRIQRRDFFRLSIPAGTSIMCIIPIKPDNPDQPDAPAVIREVAVLDISGGGIGLLCGEDETELLKGKIFHDCKIPLPGIGIAIATIEVKSGIKFTARNNVVQMRAGCQFINLSSQAESLLHRYTTRLQAEALSKE